MIPTQAVIRNQSDDVVPSLLPSGAMEDDLVPAPGPAPSAATAGPAPATATAGPPAGQTSAPTDSARPKRDPMVQLARAQGGAAAPAPAATTGGPTGTADAQVQQARLAQVPPTGTQPPIIDLPPIEGAPEVQVPDLTPGAQNLPPDLQPLPGEGGVTVPALPDRPPTTSDGRPPQEPPVVPIMPGSQRLTRITNRTGRPFDGPHLIHKSADGVETYVIRNGVNIVTTAPRFGTIDIEADSAIIWRGPAPEDGEPYKSPTGEFFYMDDARQPMQVYLEGNVIMRQDENKYAGRGDQRTIRGPRLYYDFLTDRMLAPNSQIDMFAPSFLAPITISSPLIEQFRTPVLLPNGTYTLSDDPEIRIPNSIMTASRFPNPGYTIRSKTMDLTRSTRRLANPDSNMEPEDPNNPTPPQGEQVWHIDARQNFYYGGPIPFFFWPRINQDLDDWQPMLRMIGFNTNNYFGQMFLTDWNGFRLLQMRRPKAIDLWNIDVDYLSYRTKDFPALGSEMGWYGDDLIRDIDGSVSRAS